MQRFIAGGLIDISDKQGPFNAPRSHEGTTYYTTIEWTSTYKESAGPAWFHFLEACQTLSDDPERIRFVFGFDS